MSEVIMQNEAEQNLEAKLDKRVLVRLAVGIAAYFCMMIAINNLIFRIVADPKTADYLSILISNCLFIALILIVKSDLKLSFADLAWKKAKLSTGIVDVLIIWFITWIADIVYMLVIYNYGITAQESELLELLANPSFLILLLNLFLIAVVAPFVEETLFRGLMLGSLRTYCGRWTAIIISAAVFSGLHLDLVGFVPRFILGIGLGYLYLKHQSIFPAVALHALNNFIAVMLITAVT